MTIKKVYRVASEAEMEEVLKVLVTLAHSKRKKRTLEVTCPTNALCNIFIANANKALSLIRELPGQAEMHINVFVENAEDEL